MNIKVQLINGEWTDVVVPPDFPAWTHEKNWRWLDVLCHELGGWVRWLDVPQWQSEVDMCNG